MVGYILKLERANFEALAGVEGWPIDRTADDSQYTDVATQRAFEAWCARAKRRLDDQPD